MVSLSKLYGRFTVSPGLLSWLILAAVTLAILLTGFYYPTFTRGFRIFVVILGIAFCIGGIRFKLREDEEDSKIYDNWGK